MATWASRWPLCDQQSGVAWAWPESEGCPFRVGSEGGGMGLSPGIWYGTVRGWGWLSTPMAQGQENGAVRCWGQERVGTG